MLEFGGSAAARNAEMAVVEPADDNQRLAANDKDITCLVGELARRWQNGNLCAVRRGSAAVAPKKNSLEPAVGREALAQVFVGAKVAGKREEPEQCCNWKREQQDARNEEKRPMLCWLCLAFIHRRNEATPNNLKLNDCGAFSLQRLVKRLHFGVLVGVRVKVRKPRNCTVILLLKSCSFSLESLGSIRVVPS